MKNNGSANRAGKVRRKIKQRKKEDLEEGRERGREAANVLSRSESRLLC